MKLIWFIDFLIMDFNFGNQPRLTFYEKFNTKKIL